MEDSRREDEILFVYSALNGELDRIKLYVEEKNVDIDCPDEFGYTALQGASEEGHIEIVRYLISKGANVNLYIINSCRYSDLHLVTPLFLAVGNGHIEVAKILIQSGARTDIVVGERNLLDIALFANKPELISLIMSHGFGINEYNNLGRSPLAMAMRLKADESIKFLLENGADYRKTCVNDKFLPIHYGIGQFSKSARCVKLLLDHVEKKEGRKGVVDYINSNDNSKGFTALHYACYARNSDVAKLLLEFGADRNIKDKEGRRPYDILYRIDEQFKALFESDKRYSNDTVRS